LTWRSTTQIHLGFWLKIANCQNSMNLLSILNSQREITDHRRSGCRIGEVFQSTNRNRRSRMVGSRKLEECFRASRRNCQNIMKENEDALSCHVSIYVSCHVKIHMSCHVKQVNMLASMFHATLVGEDPVVNDWVDDFGEVFCWPT
jgi:hypothetical protein